MKMTLATHAPFLKEAWPIISTGIFCFVLMKLLIPALFGGRRTREHEQREDYMAAQLSKLRKSIEESEERLLKTPDEGMQKINSD